jgi:hypothetical protein
MCEVISQQWIDEQDYLSGPTHQFLKGVKAVPIFSNYNISNLYLCVRYFFSDKSFWDILEEPQLNLDEFDDLFSKTPIQPTKKAKDAKPRSKQKQVRVCVLWDGGGGGGRAECCVFVCVLGDNLFSKPSL